MIIYEKEMVPNLIEYGIEVPALKDKYQETANQLVKRFNKDIFYNGTYPKVCFNDFLKTKTHNQSYINELNNQPELAIKRSFELIDEQGKFNRYNPKNAQKELPELAKILLQSSAGTLKTLELAYENGFCYFLGGGFHHAMSFGGRGFCLINDIVHGARTIAAKEKFKNIWVVDVDAHKGCGTAEITLNDTIIHTLSIHMAKGWPLDSPKFNKDGELNPWYMPSTIDIGINENEEEKYLSQLEFGLSFLEQNHPNPDLAIIVDGSDPYEHDELPSSQLLKLTKQQLLARDMLLFNYFKAKKVPQAYLASGGYGKYVGEIHYQFLEQLYLKERV